MIFNKATVYGGGLIGSGWAVNFLIKGVSVIIYDLDDEKLAEAKDHVEKLLNFFAEAGIDVLTADQKAECIARVSYTADVKTAVTDAEFIQENGPENVTIKRSIINAIEQYNSTAIIASSTSGLLISDIAAEAEYPQRIVGGHPYNPVHLIPLVELAKGDKTSQETLDKACQFYKEIGKEPVVLQKECRGFICNRIQNALLREAEDLVYRGICTVEEVDKAVTFGPGLRWGLMGPHLVLELGGGEGGFRDGNARFGAAAEKWYEDMATWIKLPEGYVDTACEGIQVEMSNRTPREGQDQAGLERFRNQGLVQLLKFHGKL
ncbi:MAG: 3-hydroxyacyl-CoA dehydrogenase family protein [Eubacteriales bacterium]